MDEPLGFKDHTTSLKVFQLRKALYGLKQSSRVWKKKFDSFVQNFHLTTTSIECCVYTSNTNPQLIIAIWIDDGNPCGKSIE